MSTATRPEDAKRDDATEPLEAAAMGWIRAHPWMALLGATAVGLLLAKLTRGSR